MLAVAVLAARPPEAQAETVALSPRAIGTVQPYVAFVLTRPAFNATAFVSVVHASFAAAHRAPATAQSASDLGLPTSTTSPAPYRKRRPPSTYCLNDATSIVNPARFSAFAVGIRLLTR